jgi:hypothetical protein
MSDRVAEVGLRDEIGEFADALLGAVEQAAQLTKVAAAACAARQLVDVREEQFGMHADQIALGA